MGADQSERRPASLEAPGLVLPCRRQWLGPASGVVAEAATLYADSLNSDVYDAWAFMPDAQAKH
ncbi:hypothetical protein THICB3620408 [Thiomonas sp. CB3]|nr:hypothetical protein THICB3620408 [Thiomonas sp. CB3]